MLGSNSMFNLIDEQKSTLSEIVNSLVAQKFGTPWAEVTNELAINYAKHLGEVYGDVWYKGLLPQELLLNIQLPKHGHGYLDKEFSGVLLFPEDTSVKEALNYIRNSSEGNAKECLDLVNYLKEEIRKDGFTSTVVLVVINGALKHVDGLHRMLALTYLLEEGYKYKPIKVFLCNSTK